MRDRPEAVDAVAAEAAAELVVDAALGHFRERERDDHARELAAFERMAPQAESELVGMRKLRRFTDPPVHVVENLSELADDGLDRAALERRLALRRGRGAFQGLDERVVLFSDVVPLVPIGVRDARKKVLEAGHAVAGRLREIRSREERRRPRA